MKVSFKVEGFKELDEAIGDLKAAGDLTKASTRGAFRRAGMEALEPIAEDYRQNVDVLSGELRSTIGVGTRLTPRQARLARREGKSFVEVYVGAGADPAAHLEEFGSINNAPNPALRNAWDRGWRGVLERLAGLIWAQINKAVARARRRAERDAARMGLR